MDVARVPAAGDPAVAVVRVPAPVNVAEIACEVLVVGGGTGGVAAALAAARRGRRVCLVEETDWLGGQLTAQGVSALDEHDLIERFGGTASYYELRRAIRTHYERLGLDGAAPAATPGLLGHAARLRAAPSRSTRSTSCSHPFVEAGCLPVFLRAQAGRGATPPTRRIEAVTVHRPRRLRSCVRFRPEFVIDATELGDLLPLAGVDYRIGAETIAETGEPHAQPESASRTASRASPTPSPPSARRRRAARIPRPAKYEHYRDSQPYSLTIEVHGGEIYGEESGWLAYRLFEQHARHQGVAVDLPPADRRASAPPCLAHDLTMFNWPGNDYRDATILDVPAAGRRRQRCRTPSASASASFTGCRPRRRPRATGWVRPSSGSGRTSWARSTASRSIRTSARRAGSVP